MQRHWHLHLSNLGIDPDSTSTRGGIKTVEELATRLAGVAHLYRDESLSQEYPFGSIAIDPNGKRLKLIGIRSHTDNYRRWIGVLQLLSEKAIGVAEPTIFLTDKIENLEKLN